MFRMSRPAVAGTAIALALTVGLSACQADGAVPATSESASASPSASPSPTELSPEDEAIEQAEKALRQYYRVNDTSFQDPENFNKKQYEKVAIGTALSDIQFLLASVRYEGLHQVGETAIVSVKMAEVDLTFKPKASPPEIPYVEFKVCTDISGLDTINKDGNSMKPAGGPNRLLERIWVGNYEYPDGPWLVDSKELLEGKAC